MMEVIGVLIEKYEDKRVAELGISPSPPSGERAGVRGRATSTKN